jgi:hypothetical protein
MRWRGWVKENDAKKEDNMRRFRFSEVIIFIESTLFLSLQLLFAGAGQAL